MLLDLAGDDRYRAPGYALGLGGPLGAGAVVDVAGDDRYSCGFAIPSGYNVTDAPKAKPGDPAFQYDAFGLGIGIGRRLYPATRESDVYALAGGVGMVVDVAGDDRYDSSNFSQACGYFFGCGVKLDLAGDDLHTAARYGHAAAAHYGVALFVDRAGDDVYRAAGPTYNGGCGWDRSVCLLADGGGDDVHDFGRSAGPALADRGGWGVFADLAGRDRYVTARGPARASTTGLAVFLDRGGADDYAGVRDAGRFKPADGVRHVDPDGAAFIDR